MSNPTKVLGPGAWRWLADSYLDAALVLFKRGPHRKGGRPDFWPAFYLMRHGLELTLKACLHSADLYKGPMPSAGKRTTHELSKLLASVKRRYPKLILSKRLHAFIKAIDKLDPKGEDYKYPNVNPTKTRPDNRASGMKHARMGEAWKLCLRLSSLAVEIHKLPIRAEELLYQDDVRAKRRSALAGKMAAAKRGRTPAHSGDVAQQFRLKSITRSSPSRSR